MKRLFAAPAVLVLALAASAGSVDVQLRGKDKVMGTLRPATDVECFECDLTAGTTFVATIKGASKTGPVLTLELDEGGAPAQGSTFAGKNGGGTLKFTAQTTDTYSLCVHGDGVKDGDYQLSATWKPKTSGTVPGEVVAAGDSDFFTFAAPAGSVATLDVTPAPKSKFKADLVDVEDQNGGVVVDLSDKGGTHAVVPITSNGDYNVSFTNSGDDGAWTGKFKLKLPKLKSSKIDIRDSALGGAFKDDQTVFGRVLGPDGGEIQFQSGAGQPLDGTTINVPANALGGPTVITIAAAGSFTPGGGVHSAGPAVDFGPSGTVFDPNNHETDHTKQAQITIPFDPGFFPGGDTSNLVIYVRDASGNVSQIPGPYTFTTNTVTFYTSHLSAYQAGTTNIRPFEGSFVAVAMKGDLSTNYEGTFGVGLHSLTADGSTVDVSTSDADVSWLDFGAQGSVGDGSQNSAAQTFDLTTPDDSTVVFTDHTTKPPSTLSFLRGKSDDVLIGRKNPVVLLRRAGGQLTPSLVAGQWNAFGLTFQVTNDSSVTPSVVNLQFKNETFGVTFNADGTLSTSAQQKTSSNSNFPAGSWTNQTQSKPGQSGIPWAIDDAGNVQVSPTGDVAFELIPVMRGNVLVGRQVDFGGGVTNLRRLPKAAAVAPPTSGTQFVELIVLTRKPASSVAKGSWAGTYASTELDVATVDRGGAGSQGVQFAVADVVSTLLANGNLSYTGTKTTTTHDSRGDPSTTADQPTSGTTKLTFKTDGTFTSSDTGTLGALIIGGSLFVRTHADSGKFEVSFGLPVDAGN